MKYFKNISWLFSEKILRMMVGLFVGVWVARYLGPEQFGLFSSAQSFVSLFVAFATLGLDGIVVRELVEDESKRDKLIGSVFYLKLIGAFLVLIILAIAINFTSNNAYTNTLVFIIASATIFQSFNVIDLYFQSKVLSKYAVYANVITLLVSSIIKIILVLNEASLIAFAYVVLFDSLVLALGFLYFYLYNNLPIKAWNFDKNVAISLLKDSWPLILNGIAVSIYMKIDQVMIQEVLDSNAVGQYAAAVKLSEAWYFIPIVITYSFFPAIINAKKNSKKLYNSRLQKLYDLVVWLAIIVALLMTFLSDWIVVFLYGDAFHQAGNVLMIHIWSGIFMFLGVVCSRYLTAENLVKKSLYKNMVGVFFNVFLNYLLIPKYGILGAASATFFAHFTANYVYDLFDRDLHQQLKMKTKSFIPIHILYKKY